MVIPKWLLLYFWQKAMFFCLLSYFMPQYLLGETITKVTSVIDVDKCRLLMEGPGILCIPPP